MRSQIHGALTAFLFAACGEQAVQDLAELRDVQRLGSEIEDGALLLPTTMIVANGAGTRYAAPTALKGQVAVFGHDGRFLHVIGSFGEGPGELLDIGTIWIGPGDSLWVADVFGKVSVFDRQGHYGRVLRMPGQILSAARVGHSNAQVFNLNVPYGADVSPLVLFGADSILEIDIRSRYTRAIVPTYRLTTMEAGFVAINADTYEVHAFDPDGGTIWEAIPAPSWFRTRVERGSPLRRGRVIAVAAAPGDTLWVLLVERKPRSTRSGTGTDATPRMLAPSELEDHYNYYVDIVDGHNGGLIRRLATDAPTTGLFGPGQVLVPELDDGGTVRIRLAEIVTPDHTTNRGERR